MQYSIINSNEKQTTISVLLSAMLLSYFAANGSTFMQLLDGQFKLPEFIGNIPVKKFSQQLHTVSTEVDKSLLCQTDSGSSSAPIPPQKSFCELINTELKDGHMLLTADGGFGKTVQMEYAAKTLLTRGNAVVYINLKECEKLSADQQHTFLYNKIAFFSDSWSSSSPIDPHKSFCDLIKAELKDEKIFVFLDGLNEISHKTKNILLSVIAKLDQLSNLRFVLSSRYTEHSLKHWRHISFKKLEPHNLLKGDKLAVFQSLSCEEKELLSAPMFLRLFMEDDSGTKPTVSSLLLHKVQRDMLRASADDFALKLICHFSNWLYCHKDKTLVFSREDLYQFWGEQYKDKGMPFDEIAKNISIFVKQDNDYTYSYEHENYRDLFVAAFLRDKFADSSDYGHTAVELFANNIYSDTVLLMFSQMTDCTEVLDSLRKNNFCGNWYSDDTAYATAVVYKACTLSKKHCLLYSLNLTKTHLNQLSGCDFSDCLISDATFIKNNIETAIFSILHDKNQNVLYAIGKHKLHIFDEHLQPKETFSFEPMHRNSYISCSAQNNSAVIFVNAMGEAFRFDKHKKDICCLNDITHTKISSVISLGINGGFILGVEGGMFLLEKESAIYISLPHNTPVYPVEKLGSSIVYCTQNKLMLYTAKTTKELWCLDNLSLDNKTILNNQSIIKAVVLKSRNYILNFNRVGASVVAEVKIDGDYSVCGQHVLTIEEERTPKEQVQKSLNIDYSKINGIAYKDNTLFFACNSGFIRAASRTEKGWELDESMHFDLSAISNNPGECVESICVNPVRRADLPMDLCVILHEHRL